MVDKITVGRPNFIWTTANSVDDKKIPKLPVVAALISLRRNPLNEISSVAPTMQI